MEPTHVIELASIIKDHFGWNKARCTCFAHFVCGVLTVCSVTISKISVTFSGDIQLASREKRLKRFLAWLASNKNFKIMFGRLVLRRFKRQALTLSIDRTDWKFGTRHINFLVVGIWYHGVSIPIYWVNLGKPGASNTAIRIGFMQELLKEVPVSQIEWVLADREFIGEDWFKFLIDSKVPFSIRTKGNHCIKVFRSGKYKKMKISNVFSNLKPGKTRVINNCEMHGCTVNLAACLSSDGALVVIATNRSAARGLKAYKKRWSIETLFSYLKGRGFNFEDTRILDPERGEALFLVLSFALFWALCLGSDSIQNAPLEHAKHGRPRTSVFRRGLDLLRESIIQVHTRLTTLMSYIKSLRRISQPITEAD